VTEMTETGTGPPDGPADPVQPGASEAGRDVPGLDLEAFGSYFTAASPGITNGPLRASVLAGGKSNITYEVTDGRDRWVVRRPPLGHVLATAHDMAREYRVISALAGTSVPVPRTFLLCEDTGVIGAPFYVMEKVAGTAYRSAAQLETIGAERTRAIAMRMIGTLADLHAVDPTAVGLADFGKPSGYLERQVRRWGSQWELVRLPDDDRDADVARLHSALQAAIPQQSHTSIVHGDYRIDNTILDANDPRQVRAVVDWELSTLGDPLSDAALMCVYRDPSLDLIINAHAAWTSPQLPVADELAHRYSVVSGQPLAHWNFYMPLAYFKLAIIAAGIDFRRRMSGTPDADASDRVGETVAPLIARGLTELRTSDL